MGLDYEKTLFRLVRRAWHERKPPEKKEKAERTPGCTPGNAEASHPTPHKSLFLSVTG